LRRRPVLVAAPTGLGRGAYRAWLWRTGLVAAPGLAAAPDGPGVWVTWRLVTGRCGGRGSRIEFDPDRLARGNPAYAPPAGQGIDQDESKT